jgi:carbonic anhydrase
MMTARMSSIRHLLDRNREWAADVVAREPDFFGRLLAQQAPRYLWIGCSDSRVPANEIVDLDPGELFVHRNVANVVVHTDFNCLAVLQYAVDVLKVEHVLVVGHYGCGGIKAALEDSAHGLIDNWLRHVQDVAVRHRQAIEQVEGDARIDRLCELNVLDQLANLSRTTIVQDAWARNQRVTLHGLVYGLADGILNDLGVEANSVADMNRDYVAVLARYGENA